MIYMYSNDNCVNCSMLANFSFVMHHFYYFGVHWINLDHSQIIKKNISTLLAQELIFTKHKDRNYAMTWD